MLHTLGAAHGAVIRQFGIGALGRIPCVLIDTPPAVGIVTCDNDELICIRLEKAMILLQTTKKSTDEIAALCGYPQAI